MSRVIRFSAVTIDKDNVFTPETLNQADDKIDSAEMDVDTDLSQTESAESIRKKMLHQAESEAEDIVAAANRKADSILSEAEQESIRKSKEILEEAKKNGYQEGYDKGKKEADILISKASLELKKAEEEKEQMISSVEPQMVDLVIKIAHNILGNTIDINRKVILNLINQGISESTMTGDINIRVSQEDFDVVIKSKDEIEAMAEGASSVEIVKDLSLKKSDCIIETAFGSIDCSLEQQLAGLKESLYYILNNR